MSRLASATSPPAQQSSHSHVSPSLVAQALANSSTNASVNLVTSLNNTNNTNPHGTATQTVSESRGHRSSSILGPSTIVGPSTILGQSTLQSYQNRRSSRGGGLQVVNSGTSLSGHDGMETTVEKSSNPAPFMGSLGGCGSGLSGGGLSAGGGSSNGEVRPSNFTHNGKKGLGAITTPASFSKGHQSPPPVGQSLRATAPKQRMGNLMLRELSRRSILGPQSGVYNPHFLPIHSYTPHLTYPLNVSYSYTL